jgi:hypothetical protein
MKLNEHLKQYLKSHKIKQSVLVDLLNNSKTLDNKKYTRVQMCRYVNGRYEMGIVDILNICNVLNATMNEVFGIKVRYEYE